MNKEKLRLLFKFLGKNFLQGLLVLAPIALTVYVFFTVLNYIDSFTNHILEQFIGKPIPGTGLVVMLVLITGVGFISTTFLFSNVISWIEDNFNKAPLVKIVYSSVKDLFSAFVSDKKKFNQAVLVSMIKGSGIYKLGFITQNDLSVIDELDKVAVYLPHSYNFSGNLYIVERELVKPLHISATEAMKFIVSGGVTDLEKNIKENAEQN